MQGRPILDWTLGALPRGVERVVVVTHYLAEQVEAYLKRVGKRPATPRKKQPKGRR